MLQEQDHIKNTVVLIFHRIQCLYLMYSELAWVLVSLGTQVQLQIILIPDYRPNYLSVSYDFFQNAWRITLKDDIAEQFSWYLEIRKPGSNFVRWLLVYAANPYDSHSNVWHLIDPLERHAKLCHATNKIDRKVEKSVSMHSHVLSDDHTNAK